MTDINELKRLRDHIEIMDSIHQVHIFKILKQNQIEYTENNNGVFINMTLLNNDTLKHIGNFIKYVDLQQKQLESVEDIKAKYQKEFYKDNKENSFG
uniref:NET domain-containing protein n=1 Tax=viral metagenome TaxID=1070528 RepID=A0A6C0EMH8_9ZZZZ